VMGAQRAPQDKSQWIVGRATSVARNGRSTQNPAARLP
jgi:hypothetical protein